MPDHLHVTLGLNPEWSPLDTTLSLMNNVAWVHDMQPVLMHGFRINTFGRHDLGTIQQQMVTG